VTEIRSNQLAGNTVIETDWVYTPVASTTTTSKPAAPKPATAAAPPKPSAPAPATAPKGVFVVCKADADPHTRCYNPPVDGGDGNYGTWMPSYQKFLQQNYHYPQSVGCSKLPTLDEAQVYYQTTLDQARLYTSINGIPSPIVITNWKSK